MKFRVISERIPTDNVEALLDNEAPYTSIRTSEGGKAVHLIVDPEYREEAKRKMTQFGFYRVE